MKKGEQRILEYIGNYNLPQWAATDRVLREDFNEAFKNINKAIAALEVSKAETAFGTYFGDGTSGIEHPTSLSFTSPPSLLFIFTPHHSSADLMILPWQEDGSNGMYTMDGMNISVAWSGNTISWWSSRDAISQFNSANTRYYYLAIYA